MHARDYWKIVRNRWPVGLLCFGLAFLTALTITYMTPQKFRGQVLVEVAIPRGDGGGMLGGDVDPSAAPVSRRFIENQFDIISSKEVLGRVVDDLGLVESFGAGSRLGAYRMLKGMLDTEQRKGTDMIEIEVLHEDPVMAADLANAVASAYDTRRRALFRERVELVEAKLEAEEEGLAEKVRSAQERFVAVAEKLGIGNIDPMRLARFGEADDTGGLQELLQRMQGEVFDAEKALRTAESRVAAVAELEGDALIRMAVPLGIDDPQLVARYEQYKQLQLEAIELRRAGVGEQHPKRAAVREKLVVVRGFLLDSAEEMKAGLTEGVEIARGEHFRLGEMYQDLEQRSFGARRSNGEFIAAAREYQVGVETLREFKRKIEQHRIDSSVAAPVIAQIHEHAEPDDRAATPIVGLNLTLGAVVGLVMGIGLAFFMEYLDTSAKSVDQVEALLGAPVLAVVPRDVAMLHEAGTAHPDAEAYRILRTNIDFAQGAGRGSSLTFVSTAAGEGKSTTLMNFAAVCAAAGGTVLVIDADLRRPRLHKMFGVSNAVGLTNYLAAGDAVTLGDVALRTPLDGLFFVPSGVLPADGAGLLDSDRFAGLLREAGEHFDLVLIDSPPVLGVSDASVLAGAVDGVVLVVQHGKLPAALLSKAKTTVERAGGNLLGSVLNNVDLRSDSEYQYYTSYYTYHTPVERKTAPRAGAGTPAATPRPGGAVERSGETADRY